MRRTSSTLKPSPGQGAAAQGSAEQASVEKLPDLGIARITALGLLKSELTKMRSARSLWVTFAAAFAAILGLCGYMILDGEMLGDAGGHIPFGWTAIYPVGMLVLVIFGVLAVTGEYSSGSIRITMVAAPRRTGVMLAKAGSAAAVASVLGALVTALLYVLVQITGTIPSARGLSPFDPEMFLGMLAGTLTLPYGVVFGMVLGALVRNAAAAIAIYFGLFQMGPQILPAFLPESLHGIFDYMPLAAVQVFGAAGLAEDSYGVGTAVVVLLAWLVVLGGSAWWLLKSRDV